MLNNPISKRRFEAFRMRIYTAYKVKVQSAVTDVPEIENLDSRI